MNIKLYKNNLRQKYKKIREEMPESLKKDFDQKILDKLAFLNIYIKSNIVFTYVSKGLEVDTYGIIKRCWDDGKLVAVPKSDVPNRGMQFYIIKSLDDLEKGVFSVFEPITSKCEEVTDFSKGICLVPGLAFDFQGYRLGYGHGYYDRFLPKFKGTVIGLCYSNCIKPALPHGRFDQFVDILITDKYIRLLNENN